MLSIALSLTQGMTGNAMRSIQDLAAKLHTTTALMEAKTERQTKGEW
jgi:hypothetical protein